MSTMYSLRPVLPSNLSVIPTTCMYKMKNIHNDIKEDCRIMPDVTEKKPLPEVAALEKRQERILGQLAELKDQVLTLCDAARGNSEAAKSADSCSSQKVQREAVNADLVLNVNPKNPSYSVLALEKLWPHVDFRIQPFTHCSVKGDVPQGFRSSSSPGKESVINVSFIWKQVANTEMILSSIHRHKILGEVNFLRYLGRILGDYECNFPEEIAKIDRILDVSNQLIYQESQKDKQHLVNLLDQMVGKGGWFLGQVGPGIQDLAAWSALKQICMKKLPANLNDWFKKCEMKFTQ